MAPAAKSKKKMESVSAIGKAEKGVLRIADTVQAAGENLRKQLGERFDGVGGKAKVRSIDLTISAIKLHQSAFDKAFKVVTKVLDRGDAMLTDYVDEVAWLPSEGKGIVREWSRTLGSGRSEFQKTVDKSYSLLRTYFERVRKDHKGAAKKTSAPKEIVVAKRTKTVKKAAPRPKPAPETAASSM